jgi:hypothetical protein
MAVLLEIVSPDRQRRAILTQRPDGRYQVRAFRWVAELTADGTPTGWLELRDFPLTITDDVEAAEGIARGFVG